jgi:UrcA family protein
MSTPTQSNRAAFKSLAVGLMALTLGVTSTGVLARSASDSSSSVTVSVADLDLSRSTGAQVLYKRIQQAAYEVCDGFVGPFAELRTKTSPCYKTAVENAVAQVSSPLLDRLHRAQLSRLASN